jgi:nitrogen regulatory protein P-II 2
VACAFRLRRLLAIQVGWRHAGNEDTAVYRGKEYEVSLLPKMEIEVVVPDDAADAAIQVIVVAARTGEIGDGRVFVMDVEQSYNIRTGEKDAV